MDILNRPLLLVFAIWIFADTGCTPEITPIPATSTIQLVPTVSAFSGTSNLLIQAENESVEEFVVRIAARRIINKRPFLIALSQMENRENFWFGVSRDIRDIRNCWMYEDDSVRQCASEDIHNKLDDKEFPKIFFAFAYSNSTQKLYILDYHHPWVEEDSVDGYRLVIEFQDDGWVEKSITPVY